MLEYGRACGGLGRACGRDSHRGAIAAGRCGRNRHKGAIAEEQRGRSIHRAIVVAGAERIFAIFDEAEEPEDKKDARNLATPKGEIHFSHVTFGYDSQNPILKDVSFSVPAGTKVAVVGPTGAGKTTIINLLTRFYDVQGGGIELDGGDLRDYRMEDLRKAFRVVLQDTALTQGGSQLSQGKRSL